MSSDENFTANLLTLQIAACEANQRCLLVVSGSQKWCCSIAEQALTVISAKERLWVGECASPSVPVTKAGKAKQWLGRELDLMVFDAHYGFDVDAFGALSGTVRGGGLLILLTPDLEGWSVFDDPEHRRMVVYPESGDDVMGRYLGRLANLIRSDENLSVVTEKGQSRWSSLLPEHNAGTFSDPICRTAGQLDAVNAIKRVATGHRRRPLVLTADRGRGKSAALGIAAAQLLGQENSVERVIVTAPSLASAEVVFRHAGELLDDSNSASDKGKNLLFRAPDELAESDESCDLVLVDEAAAIPAPLLEKLLRKYSRIVFASTVHGYEGTGRGFAVRFRKTLDQRTPKWRPLHISEPVRWAESDPVEAFVFRALMLNAAAADIDQDDVVKPGDCQFVRFDRDHLAKDDKLLAELFGLLVLAHYRTRPFDLRHLLDGPNIEVYGCQYKGRIVATLLAAREGEIDEGMVEPVWLGQRRVRGHLIPQSLSNHVGIPEAVTRKGLRILRIAVHPAIQRNGIGQLLIEYVSDQASTRQYDYIGSSFGATADLVEFWGHCGFQPVRVGLTREASSGCHSLMVLKPLSNNGSALVQDASGRFVENLLHQLTDGLSDLDPDIVALLFLKSHFEATDMTQNDERDIYSFSVGNRLYESCASSLKRYLLFILGNEGSGVGLSRQNLHFLIMKTLQNRSWPELARHFGFQGKNETMSRFRELFLRNRES